jgi:hypothetical protein
MIADVSGCKASQSLGRPNRQVDVVSHHYPSSIGITTADTAVGVVGSGKPPTQYNRMGKHKFDREE